MAYRQYKVQKEGKQKRDSKNLSSAREASEACNGVDDWNSSYSPEVQRRCSELMRPVHNKLDGHHQNH